MKIVSLCKLHCLISIFRGKGNRDLTIVENKCVDVLHEKMEGRLYNKSFANFLKMKFNKVIGVKIIYVNPFQLYFLVILKSCDQCQKIPRVVYNMNNTTKNAGMFY